MQKKTSFLSLSLFLNMKNLTRRVQSRGLHNDDDPMMARILKTQARSAPRFLRKVVCRKVKSTCSINEVALQVGNLPLRHIDSAAAAAAVRHLSSQLTPRQRPMILFSCAAANQKPNRLRLI